MPSCPKCGSRMVLRTARQGTRSGQQFYGCVRFPACRSTLSKGKRSSTVRPTPEKATSATSRPVKSEINADAGVKVVPMRPVDHALRQKIEASVKSWVESLVDFSRNNNLLFYRETKTTTLDLEHADPGVLDQLLSGEAVSFRDLFSRLDLLGPDGAILRRDVDARIRKIRSKAQENFEERSIGTLSLARGFATWSMPADDHGDRPPNAPVFIYGLRSSRVAVGMISPLFCPVNRNSIQFFRSS